MIPSCISGGRFHKCSFVLPCFLWLTFFQHPAAAAKPGEEGREWQIQIEALGQRNPQAQGDEVWVYSIATPQEVLPWKEAQQPGLAWEFKPKPNAAGGMAALSQGPQVRVLRAVLHGESLAIKLIRHPWSGRIRLTVNGEVKDLDLYSPGEPFLETVRYPSPEKTAPPPESGSGWWGYVGLGIGTALAWWLLGKRRKNRLSPQFSSLRPSWLKKRLLRVAIAAALGVPSSLVLSPVFFGVPGVGSGSVNLWAYGYSVGFWFGMLTLLWQLGEEPEPIVPASAAGTDRHYWLVACLISGIVAVAAVGLFEDSLNGQHAIWAKLTVQTNALAPPPLALRYGGRPVDVTPIDWQPYSNTILTIQRSASSASTPLRIEAVYLDDMEVGLGDAVIQGGIREGSAATIAARYGGMVRWPRRARHLRFRVSGDKELVTFYWLDQSRTVAVEPAGQDLNFDFGGAYQGWALLPPQQIDHLEVVALAAMPSAYAVTAQLQQEAASAQYWDHVEFGHGSDQPLTLAWQLRAPVNQRRPVRVIAGFVVAFLLTLASTALLAFTSARFSVNQKLRRVWARLDQRLDFPSKNWAAFLRIGVPIWIFCALYHLAFALCVRTGYTNDSLGYVGMAKDWLHAPYLQDIVITRTPGYPLFLAAVFKLFGDTLLGVAVVQHLSLASISLLTLWCLWDRLPRLWAAAAAVAAGLCPAVAPTANVIWVESMYCVAGSSALLLAVCSRRGPVYVLLSGICVGAATMIRPNGLLVLAVIACWLILDFLWHRDGARWRPTGRALASLLGGYLLVAAPWHMHLLVKRQTVELGKGLKEFGSWAGYIYERCLPPDLPINRPNRAILADPIAYGNDPYILQASFPLILGNDSVYYRETQAEWLASQSWRPYLGALLFDMTLLRDPKELPMGFEEVRWSIRGWSQPADPALGDGSSVPALLSRLAAAEPPGPAFLRRSLLDLSDLALTYWVVLAGAAAVSIGMVFLVPWLLPIVLYAFGTVLAFATNLVPAERYIVILEPLYCTLLVVAGLVCARVIRPDGNSRGELADSGAQVMSEVRFGG